MVVMIDDDDDDDDDDIFVVLGITIFKNKNYQPQLSHIKML